MHRELPSVRAMVKELKQKTHQFILVMRDHAYHDTLELWRDLCGEKSVIVIHSTKQLPAVISAIIGLTEGTIDVVGLEEYLGKFGDTDLVRQLSNIDIGAQAKLRHLLPYPVPKAGDIFANKGDIWPIQPGEVSPEDESVESPDRIEYL